VAIFVELKLSDITDDPDSSSLFIRNDENSTPADVVAAFEEVYLGLTAVIDRIEAAEAAAGPAAPADGTSMPTV
jgi:hypothetical protein